MRLGEKALDCLTLASLPVTSDAWQAFYATLCVRWSEKAICKKMEALATRGYIDYGVSARTGWITDKGRKALAEDRA